VLEGPVLLAEALDAGLEIEGVYVDERVAPDVVERARSAGVPVHELAAGVVERVADTVTPRPVLAVAARHDVGLDAVAGADLAVVCVGLQDPGNAGTVVRTAEAAGAGAVIFTDDTVDVFSPKSVRASAGSLFHVPLVAGGNPVQVLDGLGAAGATRLGAVAHGGRSLYDADLTGPTAVVLGSEAHGLPPEVVAALDVEVTVPHAGRTESLNVGMAAAVICFEALRQRQAASGV
jgi:TrmH family RNA methyltransferase